MTYTVNVTREGDSWLADVPTVEGAHTFARSLDGLARSVREVIILMDDLDDDADPDMHFVYQVDDPAVTHAAEVGETRHELTEREARVRSETVEAVRELVDHGYSVRDAAHLLAITPGRVSQLANA